MSPKKKSQVSAKKTGGIGKADQGLSPEERAAMKETLKERKAAASKEEAEEAVLEKIAEMQEPDRSMAEKVHHLIKATAPELAPRTWYGMPAYAKDGNVVCHFQSAQKFKTRYSTLGFSDKANLDDGSMWPVAFALKKMSASEETKIKALIKQAIS